MNKNNINHKKELLYTFITTIIFYIAIFLPLIKIDITFGSLNMDINGIYKLPRSIIDAIGLDLFPVSDMLAIIVMLVFVDLVVGVSNYIKKVEINEKHLKTKTILSFLLGVLLIGLLIFWNYYETIYIAVGFYLLILVMVLNIVRDKNKYFNDIIKSKKITKYFKIIATFMLIAAIYFFYDISYFWSQRNGLMKIVEIKDESYIVEYWDNTLEVIIDETNNLDIMIGVWYEIQYTESSQGVFFFRTQDSYLELINFSELND